MKHAVCSAFVAFSLVSGLTLAAGSQDLTLERIMADPDWIGTPAHDAYWSVDGRTVYYTQKRTGSPLTDLHQIQLSDGKDRIVKPEDMAKADGPPVFDLSGKHAAFVRNGDLFVRDGGGLRQVTRGLGAAEELQFSDDGKLLSFRMAHDWYVHDLGSALTAHAAVLKTEKDPDGAKDPDDLRDLQLRTFSTLKRMHDEKQAAHEEDVKARRLDATRGREPFYLGEVDIQGTSLSPDAHWMLVVTTPKSAAKGREGQLTRYVTESGYEEFEKERTRVGRNTPAPQSVWLLDLQTHAMHELKTDELPGIHDDPLKSVREENAVHHPWVKPQNPEAGKPRGIWVMSDDPELRSPAPAWSHDAKSLAVAIYSIDNKDRWITSVDFTAFKLKTEDRLSDPAWVNYDIFDEYGWLNDNKTLWFQSEKTGYGHLYSKKPGEPAEALTHGEFEVTQPVLSADGRLFYALANAKAPYSYDVYRLPVGGGNLERVTNLQGVERFDLEQRGRELLITHSGSYTPAQLAVVAVDGKSKARELTDTRSAEYKAMSWISPEIVQVPSRHVQAPIYGKLYRDPGAAGDRHPAVLFVHGAGYLQDVHLHYPYYFREQMFNNLLAHKGYVVLDIDYRASMGYGRDWRTAIYRQMGHPELEDMLDAKQWLIANAKADPARFGVYGGSYGGFMTLMALFRAPGEFKAGAALRPVTDWWQYNEQYTAAILNDPKVDPIAYEQSSPLEFASAFKDHLLICHGVIDDNVLFEDSMRLYERLIELHKDNFSMSPYPLDRHGFVNADSWLDEYKRIYRLFESELDHP